MENKSKKLNKRIIKEKDMDICEEKVDCQIDEEKPGISYEIIGFIGEKGVNKKD